MQALDGTGLIMVVGSCLSVGMAGFTLGGGYSDLFSNTYGLAATSVQEAKVILANGKLVHASRDNEFNDLLWGILGYGGGKLAIVLELTYLLQ